MNLISGLRSSFLQGLFGSTHNVSLIQQHASTGAIVGQSELISGNHPIFSGVSHVLPTRGNEPRSFIQPGFHNQIRHAQQFDNM